MGGTMKRKLDGEPANGPTPRKRPHASVHKLSQRHSNVSTDWDKHLGQAIHRLSPSHLPTVRAVLQRYRYMRTENPTEKKCHQASVIDK